MEGEREGTGRGREEGLRQRRRNRKKKKTVLTTSSSMASPQLYGFPVRPSYNSRSLSQTTLHHTHFYKNKEKRRKVRKSRRRAGKKGEGRERMVDLRKWGK